MNIHYGKILTVFGTRPEAIKLCPLIRELRKDSRFRVIVCLTGQHRDMVYDTLGLFDIKPDHDLRLMRSDQELSYLTGAVLEAVSRIISEEAPSLLMVQGDTASAYAAALAAFYSRIPVAHVEAGLRSGNIFSPYPEEFYRQSIDKLSHLLFAPTDSARENLAAEGIVKNVYVTGNTVIDSLEYIAESCKDDLTCTADEDFIADKGSRLILLTLHRRESRGEMMDEILNVMKSAVLKYEDVYLICPVHPARQVSEQVKSILSGMDRVRLVPPMEVSRFHALMKKACLIVTDSGGIQEEAAFLGRPVIVTRSVTDRPESISAGLACLAPTGEELRHCLFSFLEGEKNDAPLSGGAATQNLYGDGHAAERIARHIAAFLLRPDQ